MKAQAIEPAVGQVRYSTMLLVLFLVLSISTTSARTIGGARSSGISPSPLFGLRRPVVENKATTSDLDRKSLLLRLRGGSSIGGNPKYRPLPSKNNNPFQKNRDSAKLSRVSSPPKEVKEEEEKDEEDIKDMIDTFLTRDSRNSFISRVYGILSVQLGFTALVCLLFGTYEPLTNIYNVRTAQGSPLLWIPLMGVFASTIAWFRVAISPNARQKSPNKWWWLTIFTLGEAVSIGAISSLYKLRSVVTAMGATALATVTVSMYTILQQNPKYDLSQWGATLSSWTTILLVYLLIGISQNVGWLPAGFLPYSEMLYSGFAVCLFTLYLAYHTKLIVGGKHAKYRMNDKDYVFGAMALYVDIVNIFLHILALLGDERDR